MIWFTWRQFRTQTWITIAALATVGVFLVIFARNIEDTPPSTSPPAKATAPR